MLKILIDNIPVPILYFVYSNAVNACLLQVAIADGLIVNLGVLFFTVMLKILIANIIYLLTVML
jgi:hypothetical protein